VGDGSCGGAKNERYFSIRLLIASHADGFGLIWDYAAQLAELPCEREPDERVYGVGCAPADPDGEGADARNTDGIDPGTSTNVTVAHSWIDNGDDNIAIKAGVSHMSVLDNHFLYRTWDVDWE